MPRIDRENSDDAQKIIDRFIPNELIKQRVLTFLFNAIVYANDLNSKKWNVNLDKNGGFVQFNTGQEYAIRISSKNILVLVLKELVPRELAGGGPEIIFQGYNHGDIFSTTLKDIPDILAKVANSVGCLVSYDADTAKILSFLEEANKAFIEEAITHTNITQKMERAHSPGFVAYLSKYFGEQIPNPSYISTNSLEDIEKYQSSYENLKTTVRQAVIQSRIGQGKFRDSLFGYWDSKCAVTGCQIESMLRASHIKPWRVANNKERLDRFNGLLLIPNLDAAFDAGFISFDDDGKILISHFFEDEQAQLGIHPDFRMRKVASQHIQYLQYHRKYIFKIG